MVNETDTFSSRPSKQPHTPAAITNNNAGVRNTIQERPQQTPRTHAHNMPKSLLYACVGCVLLLGISAHILSISSYSRLQPIHRSTAQAPMDRKDSWSAEEDAKLTTMVQKYGAERWSPAVDRRPFTAEEHTLIANAQSLRDNMWVDIACGLNSGRTDNSVKNHWNSNHRKSQHEA